MLFKLVVDPKHNYFKRILQSYNNICEENFEQKNAMGNTLNTVSKPGYMSLMEMDWINERYFTSSFPL